MAKHLKENKKKENDLKKIITSKCSNSDFPLCFDYLRPGLQVNKIHAPYDRHYKVSTSLNPRLNAGVYMTSYGISQME